MKKYACLLMITLSILSCKDFAYDANLKKMNNELSEYFKQKDLDNNTVTDIKLLRAIEYQEIAEDKRANKNEVYETLIIVKGTWSYMNSRRIYNINDTLSCFFDKNVKLLRIGNNANQ